MILLIIEDKKNGKETLNEHNRKYTCKVLETRKDLVEIEFQLEYDRQSELQSQKIHRENIPRLEKLYDDILRTINSQQMSK
jgi:hypothetical protein